MDDAVTAKAFVYVGPWKTGSTSVRSVLRANADALVREGIDVPPDDMAGHSWMLADRWPFQRRSKEARFVASLYPEGTDWNRAWRSETDRIAGGTAHTILLHSEFFHLVQDPATTFDALRGFLRTSVCCVREQVQVATSLVAELVKEPGLSLAQAVDRALEFDLDYSWIEARWRSAGFDVAFVPYSKDVVRGVLSAMSLGRLDAGGTFENVRVPHEAVAYLYARKAHFSNDPRWGAVCDAFCDAARDCWRRFSPRPLLPTDAVALIKDRSAQSNALVVERHPTLKGCLGRPADLEYREMHPQTRALCDFVFTRALSSTGVSAHARACA